MCHNRETFYFIIAMVIVFSDLAETDVYHTRNRNAYMTS